MPGTSIIRKSKVSEELFKKTLSDNSSFDYFETVIVFESDDIIMGYDKYCNYPITNFEYKDFVVIFEGDMYNIEADKIYSEIQDILPDMFSYYPESNERLSQWLQNIDGEFIISAYNKTNGKLAILNDILRRLPYYYYKQDGDIIVSRNLKFITDLIPDFTFDKLGLTQYLVFYYTLGERTFISDVSRCSAAMLLNANMKSGECNEKMLYEFNFSTNKNKFKSVKKNAHCLANLFIKSVKNRTTPKNVISQSGGMDSRTVAGALVKTGAVVEAATWKDIFEVSELDTKTAEKIANELGINWNCFELKESKGADMLNMLKVTKATIRLAIPHLWQYFTLLKRKLGTDFTFFSGNGGDRIIGHILPNRRYLKNIDTLIDYILNFDGPDLTYLGVDNALKLTGVRKEEFMESLRSLLHSYPEKSAAGKFIHYNIFGQSLNWHHYGDDRNRNFFPIASPFWSTQFVIYAMNCPQWQKKYMYLYTNFINNINPKLLRIPYSKNRQKNPVQISDKKNPICFYRSMLNSLPNPFRFVLKKIKSKSRISNDNKKRQIPTIIDCLKTQTNQSSAVIEILSKYALEDIIQNSNEYKNETLASLLTVTTLLEYYTNSKCSIEKFSENRFDCYE